MRFATAMIERHRPVELHVFPHGRHGLGLAPEHDDVAQWTTLCARWLAQWSRE
jgi:dipeptidyl aminopeptidase/acylaminoacyl peptidase